MEVGIVGYGGYVPKFRITAKEIARIWGKNHKAITRGLGIIEKSVPDMDEDTVTIAVEAGKIAMKRADIDPQKVGALYIGSESHPYAVKPSGTVVSEALGLGPKLMLADYEFACKAGTAAMQNVFALVKSGMAEYGMAIGADTSQGRPGDALEYSAAAGGGAFIFGKNPVAVLEETYSYTTDTSDFWRREGRDYPQHGARFTGKPAYFKHVISATKGLLKKMDTEIQDFDHYVFHMPNAKFPIKAAKYFKLPMEKLERSLVVKKIGNCYSGSSPLGLCNVLDIAKPGERILMTSYGSGAGSDSFAFRVTDRIDEVRKKGPKLETFINNKTYIDYGKYAKFRGKLKI